MKYRKRDYLKVGTVRFNKHKVEYWHPEGSLKIIVNEKEVSFTSTEDRDNALDQIDEVMMGKEREEDDDD